MEKAGRGRIYGRITIVYGVILTAWILWAVFGRISFHAVFPFSGILSRDAEDSFTSTDYRYEREFKNALAHYSRFGQMYCGEASFAVPGLEFTAFEDGYSRSMVPQGICRAGDYTLISAYDNGEKLRRGQEENYVTKNSVIYILSNDGPFLCTLVLPDVNHVGGLAFDGSRIWVAKSTDRCVSAIDYEEIEKAVSSGRESVRLDDYAQSVSCGMTASFVNYYDGLLWIGTYRSSMDGMGSLCGFQIDADAEQTRLVKQISFQIPSHAQGVSFLKEEGDTYVLITASCGRRNASNLFVYQMKDSSENAALNYRSKVKLPPMAEEIMSDGSYSYVIFESAATCYSSGNYYRCSYPVDRVCALDHSQILKIH